MRSGREPSRGRGIGHEAVLALVLLALAAFVEWRSGSFFTLANLFDLLRSAVVPGLFAIGALLVLISGGIDVSFTVIAAFALYSSVLVSNAAGVETLAGPVGIAITIGLGLGLINAALVAGLGLPALIATLGTRSLFRGFLLFAIGSRLTRDLPDGLVGFSGTRLLEARTPGGAVSALHPSVLILAAVAAATWFLLRHTLLGRGIHAIGGSPEAAARIGFDVRRIRAFVFAAAGGLAGLAGIIHASLYRQANPFDLVGSELDAIAAAVLGGASIAGGRGSVAGTLLGVLLVTVLNNSLILAGIPPEWQKVAIGTGILIGTGVPALRERTRSL